MDIKTLRGDLQKIVAVNASSKPLTVDLALGLIGAFMLQKVKEDISKWKEINTFLTYLRGGCFKGKKKAIITDTSFVDCALIIRDYMLVLPFEKKKGILLSLDLKVIAGVEEDGYLSFNNKTFEVYASQKIINGIPAHKYIVDITVDESDCEVVGMNKDISQDEPAKEQPNDEATDDNIVPQVIQTIERESEISNAVRVLAAEENSRSQNTCTDNFPFVQLYDDLINKDQDNRSKAKYTWQWFLSSDEYKSIKECVAKTKIPTPSKWNNKTVCLISLYLGEFYKREYESNKNPFFQLGDNSPNANFDKFAKICECLNIEPYKQDNQAHLFTLYVNGGLPVHYISTKLDDNKTNSLIDGLSKLLDTEDDIDRIEGEEALKRVNTALRESYHNGHSIFEYIEALKSDNKTWNESDINSKEFHDFKEKIREANNKAKERRKFKIFYSLWTYLDNSNVKEFYLTPQLRFNPEEDGERHYAISKQRLENWGIKNPPAQFYLKMGDISLIFTICHNGDYISRGMVDRIDLPILDETIQEDDLSNPDYDIIYDDGGEECSSLKKDFYLPYKNGFLQFYTDDDSSMASWNSFKGAQSFLWSGLLFNKNRYQLLSPVSAIDVNEHFGWVSFRDSVTLEDTSKGKRRTFFNSKGKIYAKPVSKCIHEIINSPCLLEGSILDGMVECKIGEETSRAYLVKSTDLVFDLYRASNDEKVDVSPIVEYKSASDYRDPSVSWGTFSTDELDQGFYVFRLSYGRYTTEVKCYVLPSGANISFYNDSTPNIIKFIGFNNVTSEEIKPVAKDYGIGFPITDSKDYYTFVLGNDDGFISLQTYNPKPQIHTCVYGKEIIDKPVIMAYADDIEMKYISSNSCQSIRLSEKRNAYRCLFNALTATALGKTTQLLTQSYDIKLFEGDKLSKIKIRVYTQEIPINSRTESAKMMLLDLEDNKTLSLDYSSTRIIPQHDSLLFQSLKDISYTDVFYAPKFISRTGQDVKNNVKKDERQRKLADYADMNNRKSFVTDYAYQQFEIACEHKLYFPVFDPLLGMCWDVNNKTFLDVTKTKFKKNLLCFLQGYIDYTNKYSHELCIAGLKRLAREFLFDWKIIKKDIEKKYSQQLKDLYQEIINN